MTGPHLTPEREADIRAAVHAARLEAMHMPHGNGDLELLRGHLAEAERLLEELAPATAWGSSAAQRVGECAGVPAGASDLSAALDAERADHAQTRAALTSLTTVGLEVLGSVRAVYGDTNQLVRDLDAQIQEAQRALGLVRPAPETT